MKQEFYDIPSNTTNEVYSVILRFVENGELERSSCTCPFDSFYGQSQKNKGKVCRHIRSALNIHKNKKLKLK
jgi:phage-related protein